MRGTMLWTRGWSPGQVHIEDQIKDQNLGYIRTLIHVLRLVLRDQ